MWGAHYVWTEPGIVEAEAYVVNPGATRYVGEVSITALLNSPDDVVLTLEIDYPRGDPWAAGELRKWSATFREVPPKPYRLSVFVFDGTSWDHSGDCLTPEREPLDTCQEHGATPESDPAFERGLWPQLMECCQWRPSPLDNYALECRPEGTTIACSAKVIDWRGDPIEPAATADLRIVDVTTGAKRNATTMSVDIGGAFAGNETRAVSFTIPLTDLVASGAGSAFGVELKIADAAIPRSIVNETVSVKVLPSEQGFAT